MRNANLNTPIEGATEDSGWVVTYDSRCITDWTRTVKTSRPHDEVARELIDRGDFPGWTGVHSKQGKVEGTVVFTSTWDSSD